MSCPMRKLAALVALLDTSRAMTRHDTAKTVGRRGAMGAVGRRDALGGALGIIVGCVFGMFPLLFYEDPTPFPPADCGCDD